MDLGAQIPPIPPPDKVQKTDTLSRPTSSGSEVKPLDPFSDSPAHEIIHDDSGHLDVQYLELVSNFQSVVEKLRDRMRFDVPSPNPNIFSSLQTALVDLKVWAQDLSDDGDSVLSSLRDLSERPRAMLQQVKRGIRQSLEFIESEVERMGGNESRAQALEKLLTQCRVICDHVETLKTLKPYIEKEMDTSSSRERIAPTARNKTPPPSVLSLDGGGIKSYATLLILQRLMKNVAIERSAQTSKDSETVVTKPCDVFGFIFGSSSGGLLAIMLGRLQMTVEECIERFLAASDDIFAHPRLSARLLGSFSASRFDGERIQQATRRLVANFDPTPDDEKWKRNVFGTSESHCKTGVLATNARTMASYMLRTYDCQTSASESLNWTPLNPGSRSRCQVWEAARATSAAPMYFPPIHIAEDVFIDGGVTANNPSQEALREVAYLYGNNLSGACIVSIGSGVYCGTDISAFKLGKKTTIGGIKSTFRALRAAATQTESTSSDVLFEASLNLGFAYFRLNSSHERDIPLDQWDKSRQVQAEIEKSTERYLATPEAQESLRRCASTLVSKLVRNVEFYTRNVHFYVPRPPNSLFTGRYEELHRIKLLLTHSKSEQVDSPKILVITGLGGQGKSEICIKLAHEMREEFWGVFWVDVGTIALAESGFIAIATTLGSRVQNVLGAVQVLANTKEKWLLILDNADDPGIDYQQFFPPGKYGTVIITSRMIDCSQYNTIGLIELGPLANAASLELLMKASRLSRTEKQSHTQDAEEIINALGHSTLAVIQAGAYIAAGHCKVDEYVKMCQVHRQRMLTYEPRQASPRYGNIYATFEVCATTGLNGKSEQSKDALCLLEILAMLHFSDLPFQIFEEAWNGSQKVLNTGASSRSTLTQWHISHLPSFLVADQSECLQWDPYRLNEASHLLQSFALITRANGDLAMHPLVHAWAIDRQDRERKAQSWLSTGCVIALSNYGSSFWIANQSRLRTHLHTFLDDVNVNMMLGNGPADMILGIVLECGNILLKLWNGSSEGMTRIFEQTESECSRVFGPEHAYTSTSQANLASIYRYQGRWEAAEKLEVRALETRERVLGEEHPSTLSSMSNLALTFCYQGRWNEAEELGIRVMEISLRVLDEDHPDTLASMTNLTLIYRCQGRWTEAEVLDVQVMEMSLRELGSEHPNTLISIANLASTYRNQRRWKKAEELEIQVMETRKRVLGSEHPHTLTSMNNLALVLSSQGEYEEAERINRQALMIRARVLGKEHPSTLTSMNNLAEVLNSQGKHEEAEDLYRQTLVLRETVLGKEHPSTIISMDNLASVLGSRGNYEEAEQIRQEALILKARVLGKEHPSTVTSMNYLAEVLNN